MDALIVSSNLFPTAILLSGEVIMLSNKDIMLSDKVIMSSDEVNNVI